MNKILLNIYIPASGKTIEIKAAYSLKIAELTNMLYRYLSTNENNMFKPTWDTRLCSSENGEMYPYNAYLADLQLVSGSTIFMV